MKIEFSLLSVLSIAYLLIFGTVSTEISLDSVEVNFVATCSALTVNFHPVWVVWVPQEIFSRQKVNALAFGNVMVFGEHMRGGTHEDYVFAHERIHLDQFRALGWWITPAVFVLDIEPDRDIITDWNDPTQPAKTMWIPPDWWPFQWSFLCIGISRNTHDRPVYFNPNASR